MASARGAVVRGGSRFPEPCLTRGAGGHAKPVIFLNLTPFPLPRHTTHHVQVWALALGPGRGQTRAGSFDLDPSANCGERTIAGVGRGGTKQHTRVTPRGGCAGTSGRDKEGRGQGRSRRRAGGRAPRWTSRRCIGTCHPKPPSSGTIVWVGYIPRGPENRDSASCGARRPHMAWRGRHPQGWAEDTDRHPRPLAPAPHLHPHMHRLTVQRESALKTVIRTRPTEAQEIETLRKM